METEKAIDTTFSSVLFCTDLSENADHAFPFALDAVRRRPGSQLHILHVIPESGAQFWKSYVYEVEDVDNKAKQDLDARMAESYLASVSEDIPVSVRYRVGKDWHEILSYADEIDCGLIVLGRQGKGSIQQFLNGSVAEKIVRKAKCAVLVVPLQPSGVGASI